ncbi:MAG TPA: glycoside hydrolase family 2 TIM barrel-domain containing protein [Chthoniobacterales bacterium]|nr:glycoside hydrolase family 2 TIM barrel-domain containing protein [Chthoniobacterales bacterium]
MFPISGANCYFLAWCSREARLPMLRAIRERGGVARVWGFGPCVEELCEDAESEGVRLILPLENHWPDFGGAPRRLEELGITGPVEEFYRGPEARALYQQRSAEIILRHRGSPAILAWELANEPRCDRDVLVDWAREMSAWVKSLDPERMVAVGDEGQDTETLLEIESVDFGTYHLYPESWGMTARDGLRWIERHVEMGRRAGKPVVLEEYGLRDPAVRERWYPEWVRAAEEGGGSLVWMLGSRNPEVAGFRDEFTIDV